MNLIAKRLIAGAFGTLLLVGTAFAQSLSADDTAALQDRLTSFNSAMAQGDFAAVIASVPPNVFALMAKDAGLSVDDLRTTTLEQTKAIMAAVNVISYEMRLDDAEVDETSAGRPFALIPTLSLMENLANGLKVQTDTATLAFAEAGVWHLMNLDDPRHVANLKQAYPEFGDIEFPKATHKVLE